jgi:hypothetical protein
MEYGSIIWDPYTKQEITQLESIQRRGARFITKDYKSSLDLIWRFDFWYFTNRSGGIAGTCPLATL